MQPNDESPVILATTSVPKLKTANAPAEVAGHGGGGQPSQSPKNHHITILTIVFLSMLIIWAGLDPNTSTVRCTTHCAFVDPNEFVDVLRVIDNEENAASYQTPPTDDNATSSVGSGSGSGSEAAAAAVSPETADDVTDSATITIASSDAQTYISPNSFTSTLSKKCVETLWSQCNSGGADRCRWRPSICNYNNHDCYKLTQLFPNRTFVFRGDSTLREQFSVWSFYCCPWAAPVRKSDTNMSSRETVVRHHPSLGLRSYFHFDYLFDHLLEPIPRIKPNETIDAVVVGLGMYQAKAITTNKSDQDSLGEIANSKIQKVIQSVCDLHKAKVGFFVGGWMECAAMRKHKAKTVRQNGKVCPASAAIVSTINRMMRNYLAAQPPRKDGCYVHYIPAMKCRGQRKMCTGDGVHARSNGLYGNTKFQLLFNAAKVIFKTAPRGR